MFYSMIFIWLGYTALHGAADLGHLEVLKCLLVNGSSVQDKNYNGKNINIKDLNL